MSQVTDKLGDDFLTDKLLQYSYFAELHKQNTPRYERTLFEGRSPVALL